MREEVLILWPLVHPLNCLQINLIKTHIKSLLIPRGSECLLYATAFRVRKPILKQFLLTIPICRVRLQINSNHCQSVYEFLCKCIDYLHLSTICVKHRATSRWEWNELLICQRKLAAQFGSFTPLVCTRPMKCDSFVSVTVFRSYTPHK